MNTKRGVNIEAGAIVCHDTNISGDVTIEEGTIVHPHTSIIAEVGPIILGTRNIVEENVVIINKNTSPLIIGDENVFEVGSYIESSRIGDRNVFEAKARVLGTTVVGNNCVVGCACCTEISETIPDNTVIYGARCNRRLQKENSTNALHLKHLDYLREILPKFNHL
ncbi:trimeric LpxA-like protein, partial [Basidiobolus meristosporus CBS 931.73]